MKKLVFCLMATALSATLFAAPNEYPSYPPSHQPGAAEQLPQPQPGEADKDGVVVKEIVLSTCYVLPLFEETKDIYSTGYTYKTFYVNYGYKVRTNELLVVVDPSGQKVFTKEITKETPEFKKAEADGGDRDKTYEDARQWVLADFQHWYNARRNLVCKP